MKRHALLLCGSVALATATAAASPVTGASAAPTSQVSPAWLRADKPAPKPALETKRGPSPLRVGGMLLLVATLGGVAFYARRRRQTVGAIGAKKDLKVLSTTRVGAKASAVIVEVSGKRLLLGVTDQAVSTLAWLDDEANAAVEEREDSGVAKRSGPSAAAPDDVVAAGPSGFLRLLRNAVGTGAKAPGAAADELARTTRDEVRISGRKAEPEPEDDLEGQVMGLAKRRRDQS